jgi:hypothetical protein
MVTLMRNLILYRLYEIWDDEMSMTYMLSYLDITKMSNADLLDLYTEVYC